MLYELRSQALLLRSVRSKTRNIEQAIHTLTHRLLRAPAESEIAEEMGVPLPEYQQLLEEARGVQILHYEDLAGHGEDAGSSLERSSEDGSAMQAAHWSNPLNQIVSKGLRLALMDATKRWYTLRRGKKRVRKCEFRWQ